MATASPTPTVQRQRWSLWITGIGIVHLLFGGVFLETGLYILLAGAEAINTVLQAQNELGKVAVKVPGARPEDAKKIDDALKVGARGLNTFIAAAAGVQAVIAMLPGFPFLLLGLGILYRSRIARVFALLLAVPIGLLGAIALLVGLAVPAAMYVALPLLGYAVITFGCLIGKDARMEFAGAPAGRLLPAPPQDVEPKPLRPASHSASGGWVAVAITLLVLIGLGGGLYFWQVMRQPPPPPLTAEQKEQVKRQERFKALMEAAEKGQVSRVIELHKEGAHLDDKDDTGETPLMKAAARGNINVVTYLLLSGVHPNERDTLGERSEEHTSELQ